MAGLPADVSDGSELGICLFKHATVGGSDVRGKSKVGAVIRSVPVLGGWAVVGLVMFGVITGCDFVSNPTAIAAQPVNVCEGRSVVPPRSVKDVYDRYVLSLAPAMYLTMRTPVAATEPDLSGNGHAGTYYPVNKLPSTVDLPNGDPAAQFDGNGQYLEVPSAPSLSVTHTGCLTVQAWVRPSTLQFPHEEGSGYVYILGKGSSGKQEYALRMYSYKNSETPERPNRISAYVFNLAGGKGSGAYFQDKVQLGTWMMITFIIDDRPSPAWPTGYVAIYKNDQLRGQVSISQFNVTPGSSDAPLCVATRQLDSFFQGAVGKVAVFDYVLSRQQIQGIYDAM